MDSETIRRRAESGEATVEESTPDEDVRVEEWARLSQGQLIWRRFLKSKAAIAGGILLFLFYFGAAFCEFFAPYQPNTRFTDQIYAPPNWPRFVDESGTFHLRPFIYELEQKVNPQTLDVEFSLNTETRYPVRFFVKGDPYELWTLFPSDIHLFGVEGEVPLFLMGSDRQGRDLLTRILFGSRVSLTVGLIGVFVGVFLGSFLGVLSGYYGGLVDDFMQRSTELLMSIPHIPLWMALAAILPVTWSAIKVYFGVTIILSLLSWGRLARQIRGKTLALREEAYTLAARAAGASDLWIIFKHLLPNNFSHIIVIATLSIPYMILGETALSFLGLGIRPPMTSWGVLLEEAQNVQTIVYYPWLIIPAGLVILAVLGFNFLGDGLRDAADPFSQ